MLYKNDIAWCERLHLKNISDLASRIVSNEQYEKLWIRRCDHAYNLLTKTDEAQRAIGNSIITACIYMAQAMT